MRLKWNGALPSWPPRRLSSALLRPPYGRWDEDVLAVCAELGYHLVLWDVDSRDWEYDCPKTVLKKALTGLKPGSIVLFHDGPRQPWKCCPGLSMPSGPGATGLS